MCVLICVFAIVTSTRINGNRIQRNEMMENEQKKRKITLKSMQAMGKNKYFAMTIGTQMSNRVSKFMSCSRCRPCNLLVVTCVPFEYVQRSLHVFFLSFYSLLLLFIANAISSLVFILLVCVCRDDALMIFNWDCCSYSGQSNIFSLHVIFAPFVILNSHGVRTALAKYLRSFASAF